MCDCVGPIIEIIKANAKRYLTYHIRFDAYVDDFRQAQADLHAREADVRQQLQDEHRFGKIPKQEVEHWFKKVEEKIDHAQHVADEVSKGKCLFRSCLGKLVDETTQAIKGVYAEGQFSGSLVINDSSIVAAELPAPELTGETNVIEEIFKYLMEDEVRMIGVCGMGGIGKTTIMKHVHNRLLKEDKFKKLIWVTVSGDFDARRLQNDIASQLKEKLSDDENTTTRARNLSQILRNQGSCVLILDDVWCHFSLEDVGILEPTVDNGCKLLLTTRSEQVVRSMGCKKVQVPCLSSDEAMQLFLSKVGQGMLPNPDLESIMKDVVLECDGLPLAIVIVAGCMKGISDPLLWENALNELRGYIKRSLQDVKDKVFGCLQFSYDRLEQKDKDCFLFCSFYPEDYVMEKEEIVEYWMEEGLIDEMETRQAMQGSGHSILWKLEENCLLERDEEGTRVKMHDVVRDMTLHLTRNRFLVKAGKQLEELPDKEVWGEDLEKVSLMMNGISKIPQNMLSPKCQKLTTLLLSNNSFEEIPESFFDRMPNLKILDLSHNYSLRKLPNSISNLENLTALLLHHCENLEGVPSLSKLQALKKLNLERTSIKKIPEGLEMLINLRYLNLHGTWKLEEIPDGILSKLDHLQHLIVFPASSRAEETNTLKNLEVFEVCFSGHEFSIYARKSKRIYKYNIWVSDDFRHMGGVEPEVNYGKLVTLANFKFNTEYLSILLPSDICNLKIYGLHVSDGGRSSLNNMFELKDVIGLETCSIEYCEGLGSIFSSWCASLQTLELLRLKSLENSTVIVEESVPSPPGTFSSLKVICLSGCEKLKFVLSAKWDLHNLEEIEACQCGELEEVIASEEEKEEMSSHHKVMVNFPKLRKLVLWKLPKLKSICQKSVTIVSDSLQQMKIVSCPELMRIPLYLPLDDSQPTPPPSLNEIYIDSFGWWESVEWDNPNAKDVLLPFVTSRLLRKWEKKEKLKAYYTYNGNEG